MEVPFYYLYPFMKQLPNIPFAPDRIPVFYGWIILAVGTIGIIMSLPGQTIGVSIFTESLLRDLEINRNNLSLAYLIGTVGSGLLITRAGKMYDRFGARFMAFISAAMLGVMLLFLTRVQNVVRYFHDLNGTSPAIVTFVFLAFGFWGIRFFGQGLLTMISRNMVMKWFNKRRGLANGVLGIFSAFGFSLAPKIFDQIIQKLDWQGTWMLLGAVVGLGFVVIVLIFYRDNPADCGCVADGAKIANRKFKRPPSLPDRDYSLPEARKTRAFWAFTFGLTLTALYISGLIFHVVSVFGTSGMSKEMALGIFVPVSLIAIAVQFFFGYISDFMRLKYLLMFFMLGMLTTSIGLSLLGTIDAAYWMIITGNGIVWGMYTVLIAVTWPRFYGLKHLGAISGFSLSLAVIGSALGPYLFSLSFKLTGHYYLVAWLCIVLSLFLFSFAFKANNPNEMISGQR
jgi:OFA family oxalate/formate antiporter-like MFS transporter